MMQVLQELRVVQAAVSVPEESAAALAAAGYPVYRCGSWMNPEAWKASKSISRTIVIEARGGHNGVCTYVHISHGSGLKDLVGSLRVSNGRVSEVEVEDKCPVYVMNAMTAAFPDVRVLF